MRNGNLLESQQFYDFADFRLDISEKVLLHNGIPVPLTPKVFDTLCLFVKNAGQLLEKEELISKLWQNQFVEDSNLTYNVKMLRKALGDDAAHPRFIETIPRRGYRFIAEVRNHLLNSPSENLIPQEIRSLPVEKAFAKKNRWKLYISFSCAVFFLVCLAVILGRNWQNYPPHAYPILNSDFASENISTSGKVFNSIISLDGKNVFYTNRVNNKESIWLKQLDSNTNIEIIPPSNNVYFGLALSPIGDVLYFSRKAHGEAGQQDIYRVSSIGGTPTKIISETQGWIDISPDGKKISFVRCYYRDDENCSLSIADSLDGKNEQKIVSRTKPLRIGDNKFSPDGKTIVFAVGQSENKANEFGFSEVNIENGQEKSITDEKFFNIRNLIWMPDGKSLLFTASRIPNKNFRIWEISLPEGEVQPITNDSENYSSLSLNKAASLLVSTKIRQDFQLHLFHFDNSPGNPALADASTASFTPDGKILFTSPMSGNDDVWITNQDGSGQRQLTNDKSDDSSPIASPDSNSIFFASNRTGKVQIWRMNIDGSNQTQITQNEGGFPLSVSADGNWVYYHHGLNRTLWRVSTKGESEQLIFNKANYKYAVSPDGSKVAFSENRGGEKFIVVSSLIDKQILSSFKYADSNDNLTNIVWMPDGKSVAYILASKDGTKTLWMQPLNEVTPRQIANIGNSEVCEFSGFAISQDSKSYIVTMGDWKNDAVLLKGLK